jgi:four helix bundle protein
MDLHARYLAWAERPPDDLVGDPIWRLPAFRMARFLALVSGEDATRVRSAALRDVTVVQLLRAIESISANIAEGYSRFSGRDRARFYELALGSAREAREWYSRLSGPLGAHAVAERTALLNHIVRILTYAIPEERAGASERRMSRKKPEKT